MTYTTLEGVLHPNGSLALPPDAIPAHSVRVLVTLLEDGDDASLSDLGDYHEQLSHYEDLLARGDIKWQ